MAQELEIAHRQAVIAAQAGLCDAALADIRLTGPAVHLLAEAAVSSATPFVRAPLLGRISGVQRLHPALGDEKGKCPVCDTAAPCQTARELAA